MTLAGELPGQSTPGEAAPVGARWLFGPCDLCGESGGEDILALPHADAPAGLAFIRQCRGCGLRRLWPRPGDEIISRYYDSDYGAYVGRRRSPFKQGLWDLLRDGASGAPGRGRQYLRPWRPVMRWLADRAFDINVPLDRDPLPRLLDVGCGFGDLLLYWQSRGVPVLGIDVDERAVQAAAQLGLAVLQGTLAEQRLPAASFDAVVFNHSLEHVSAPLDTLRQAAHLLRPGGEVHLTVPNGGSAGLAVEKAAWAALCLPVHFWFFSPQTLAASLKAAGFHQVKITTRNMWRHRLASLKSEPRRAAATIWQLARGNCGHKDKGDLICAVATRR